MFNRFHFQARKTLLLSGLLLLSVGSFGPTPASAAPETVPDSAIPAPARQEGLPLREADSVLFRFHAPEDAAKVYLGGSFNSFANNENGTITDPQFAMTPAGGGYFFSRALVDRSVQQYKYVVRDAAGQFRWIADPQVSRTDADGNSVLDFSKIADLPASPNREGAPVRDGNEVLFRFRAPAGTVRVYLAGSFNGFANAQDGVVNGEQFAMTAGRDGLFTKRVNIGMGIEKYKYVVVDKNGQFNWVSDPFVKATDTDGNTVLDFSQIERLP